MSFSTDIKKIRTGLMLSQTEFGQFLGVDYSTINRWENNKGKPNFKAQKAIAAFCKERGIEFDVIKALEDKT